MFKFCYKYTDALDWKSMSGDLCCNNYCTYPNTQSLSRWKKSQACRKGLFLSDDESDMKEEQVSNDLSIVIPTRKANPCTKTRQNLIIPNKDVPVRPHAIKRDIPETTRPPSKRMRHIFRQKRLRHHLECSYMSPSL